MELMERMKVILFKIIQCKKRISTISVFNNFKREKMKHCLLALLATAI